MTIIDHINNAGDKLLWQKLADSYTEVKDAKKYKKTSIKFDTSITTDQFTKGEYIGLVIWLPKNSIKNN